MWTIRSLFLVKERRVKTVRVGQQEVNKIQVTVKTAKRDAKDGKIKYETIETFDVFEATPQEVKEAVLRGLSAASSKK